MRLHSLALLGFCLLSCPAAWAEEPPEDAPADSVDAPAANERPLLPERSISDAQTLAPAAITDWVDAALRPPCAHAEFLPEAGGLPHISEGAIHAALPATT